jgi:hypothetical protein
VTPGGGNGGGIVMLVCANISGSGLIIADGLKANDTFASHNDGASGGGGGGTVILKTPSISSSQTVTAIGGDGGNQFVPGPPANPNESDGPGGGGGGGVIATAQVLTSFNIAGGLNGTTQSPSVTEFIYNGATKGASGQTLSVSHQITAFIEGGFNPNDPCNNLLTFLDQRETEVSLRIYPNPFNEILHLDGYSESTQKFIWFFDLFGRVIHKINLTASIFTGDLTPGMYIIGISDADRMTYIGKFVKE